MYYRFINKLLTVICIVTTGNYSNAQIDEYVALALEHNLSLSKAEKKLKIVETDVHIAKSYLLPKLTFNNNFTLANGGRKIAFPSGDLLNPVYQALYQMTGNNAFNITIPNFSEQLYPNAFYTTFLNAEWSLYNNQIREQISKAIIATEIQQLENTIEAKRVTKEVKTLYLEFYKHYKLLELYNEITSYLEQVKQKTQKLVDYGYAEAIDVDYLAYELAKQKQERLALENGITQLKKQFENIVGVPNHYPQEITSDADFLNDISQFKKQEIDSVSDAKVELRLFAEKQNILHEEMKSTALWKPSVGLNLRSGFEGFANNMNAKDHFFYLGVISVNWTLYEGGKNNRRKEKVKLQQEVVATEHETYKENLELLIHKAVSEIDTQEEELQVLEKKQTLSKRLMDHERKKYLQGDIDVVSLLNYKTKYQEDVTKYYTAKISYLQAIVHYNWLVSN